MGRKLLKYLSMGCKQYLFVSVLLCFLTASISCTKSPGGSVEELIKTSSPNFGGQLTGSFLSPSTVYLLNGNCDPISYAIEWSYDNAAWTEIAGACPAGTFNLTVTFTTIRTVYVRARTKTGYTATAIATIRLQVPPTSHHINLVNASTSDLEVGASMQGSLESVGTAISDAPGVFTLKSSAVDAAYGP